MKNIINRLKKLEKDRVQIPIFEVHFKDGRTQQLSPADCIPLLQYPTFETVTHFSAEGDLSGYGEFLNMFNALLDNGSEE